MLIVIVPRKKPPVNETIRDIPSFGKPLIIKQLHYGQGTEYHINIIF